MPNAFVAVLTRLPNGKGVKFPRNVNHPAVPLDSTTNNYASYLTQWPIGRTRFLIYGSTRSQRSSFSAFHNDHTGRLWGHRSFSSTTGGPSVSSAVPNDAVSLYGPGAPPEGAPVEGKKAAKAKRFTVLDLQSARGYSQRGLSMVTCYDTPTATLADKAGVNMLLIGDSVGMVCLGQKTTVSVTMDEMVHHCKAVSRGAKHALIVGDLPFGSYLTVDDAVRNAARLVKEGGVDAVKLEGGKRVAAHIRAITDAGMAVVAHIGLTPQSYSALGGFKLQGKTAKAALDLTADALAVQEAGAVALVLEMIPSPVAQRITEALTIPTIGIGAGSQTTGQVLVMHDILGMFDAFSPKFSKRFADIGGAITTALQNYAREVSTRTFPTAQHAFAMPPEDEARFLAALAQAYPDLSFSPATTATAEPAAMAGASEDKTSTAASVTTASLSHVIGSTLPSVGNDTTTAATASDAASRAAAMSAYATKASALLAAAAAVTEASASYAARASATLAAAAASAAAAPNRFFSSAPQSTARNGRNNSNGGNSSGGAAPAAAFSPVRIVVDGGGAIGTMLATRLALALFPGVTEPSALSTAGVTLISARRSNQDIADLVKGGFHLLPPPGISVSPRITKGVSLVHGLADSVDPAAIADASVIFFVCVKGRAATERAARTAKKLMSAHPDSFVVTLQNGFGYGDILDSILGAERVMLAVTTEGATLLGANRVQYTGHGSVTLMPRSQWQDALAARLAATLARADFTTHVCRSGEPQTAAWSKLFINAYVNPVAALLGARNGALAEPSVRAALEPLLRGVVAECLAVAEAARARSLATAPGGGQAPKSGTTASAPATEGGAYGTVDQTVERIMAVLKGSSNNVSSMLADIRRRAGTEIEFINGFVVRTGTALGIPVPMNVALMSLVRALETLPCSSPQHVLHHTALAADATGSSSTPRAASSPSLSPSASAAASSDGDVSVLRTVQEMRAVRREFATQRIAFVPTMGALHDGHLELVRAAKKQGDKVVVSIFVNPTQFAAHEDLDKYPRTLDRDLQMLASVGADYAFVPSVTEMYGAERNAAGRPEQNTWVSVDSIEGHVDESKSRPGFFRGVATVVAKLFNIVQPDVAVFGQKDAVQCIVIRQMARELNFATEICVVPTRRDPDGLAMSSRNAYLSPTERAVAPVVYQSLLAGAQCTGDVHDIRAAVRAKLSEQPLVHTIDYISVANADTGMELADGTAGEPRSHKVLLSVAVRLGTTRLIDNIVF